MTSSAKRNVLHTTGCFVLICFSAGLWLTAEHSDVKTEGTLDTLAFFVLLAALAVGGSTPLFHLAVGRLLIGLFVFFATFLFSFVLLRLPLELILDNERRVLPDWFGVFDIVVSIIIGYAMALYVTARYNQQHGEHGPRGDRP